MNKKHRPFFTAALALAGLALAGTSLVTNAHADEWDKRTTVTIGEPTIVGNKVLQPGSYVWRLLDSTSDRHIVQIFDKDTYHLEETILAIPDYRLQPADHSSFTYWETPAGVPKAVHAWFYPGDNTGQEFVYPKKLVAQLVAAMPVPVAYNPPAVTAEPKPAPVETPEAAAKPEENQPATNPAASEMQPTPEPAQAAPTTATSEPASLPHTASNSPIVGLLGLASLGMAGLLSLTMKKQS